MIGLKKNLRNLDLASKKSIIENNIELSITDQCEIVSLARSIYYHKKLIKVNKNELKWLLKGYELRYKTKFKKTAQRKYY